MKPLLMLKEVFHHLEGIKSALLPDSEKIRFVNWYLMHGCDLECSYCMVPKQKVKSMTIEQRWQALEKLHQLSSKESILSILGGEPTLRPDLLVEGVRDATKVGFFVNLVTNGWGLTPELIERLSEAGLKYLAMSVDCDENSSKQNLSKALELLPIAKQQGIIPVVNTIITSNTNSDTFKQLTKTIIDKGLFISPLACSPENPGGVFSKAPADSVPTKQQLREIIPWLAWTKLTTGLVTASFSYLWTLFNTGSSQDGDNQLWHCSSQFRTGSQRQGRGFLTLDSDGFIGPCQEFPRLTNLLDIPSEQLSLQLLDEQFSETTQKCRGCLYNCYINEEETQGLMAFTEFPTFVQAIDILSNKRQQSIKTIRELPQSSTSNIRVI